MEDSKLESGIVVTPKGFVAGKIRTGVRNNRSRLADKLIAGPSDSNVFLRAIDAVTGEVIHEEGHNITVDSASLLMSQLLKGDNVPGITSLAVGLGGVGWNPFTPPSPSPTQTFLVSELFRKPVTATFVDSNDDPTLAITNKVDFFATLEQSEGNGALMELGLFGGLNSTVPNNGVMVAYRIMAAFTKNNTMRLEIRWRLTT